MKKRTILLVEADAHVMKMLKLVLQNRGLTTICTPDKQVALEIIGNKDRNFDLALLDLNLQTGDRAGIELAKEIHNARPDVKVVVMSGGATHEEYHNALTAGAKAVIGKPFSPLSDLYDSLGI